MQCFVCDEGTLQARCVPVEGIVRREKYTVETDALVCDACGHIALEGKDAPKFMKRVADAYRRKHSYLASEEIRHLRRDQLVMTQKAFAKALDVSVISVKRWELGLIQDRKNDRAMRALLEKPAQSPRLWPSYEYVVGYGTPIAVCADEVGWDGLAHAPPDSLARDIFAPHPCLL